MSILQIRDLVQNVDVSVSGIQVAICPPILECWSSFLDLQYCILWNSLNSEINFQWILLLRNGCPCAPCAPFAVGAADTLVLLRYGFLRAPQCVLLLLLWLLMP